MIDISTSIWISIGLLAYYTVFQIFSDFVRAGMARNTPNREIAKLRTKYKVTIRTFQKNNNLLGFAWFKSIWLNENLLEDRVGRKKALYFTFHHEHYHLMHNHKFWMLFMRFSLSLLPLLMSVVYWWIVIILFFSSAMCVQHVSNTFEKKADEYAKKKIDKSKSKK